MKRSIPAVFAILFLCFGAIGVCPVAVQAAQNENGAAFSTGDKEEFLKDLPTPESRKNAVLRFLSMITGDSPSDLPPADELGQLRRVILLSPDAEGLEYRKLALQTILEFLKTYDENKVRTLLKPHSNEHNPLALELVRYKGSLVRDLAQFSGPEHVMHEQVVSRLTQIAKADGERVVRGRARGSLIEVGIEEPAAKLAIDEIKTCPTGLQLRELPGQELLMIKNQTVRKQAMTALQTVIEGQLGASAKRNAAHVLLSDMGYGRKWRKPGDFLGAQGNQETKLHAVKLMTLLDDPAVKKAVEDEVDRSSDSVFKSKARTFLRREPIK